MWKSYGGAIRTSATSNGARSTNRRATAGAFTNTGTTTLSDPTLDDPLLGGPLTYTTGDLAPGDSVDCDDVTYTLTQDDLDTGSVNNTATATATGQQGPLTPTTDSTSTALDRATTLQLAKTAGPVEDQDGDRRDSAGDTVTYTFTPDPKARVARIRAEPMLQGVRVEATVPLTQGPCQDWRTELRPQFHDPNTVGWAGRYPNSCGERDTRASCWSPPVCGIGVIVRTRVEASSLIPPRCDGNLRCSARSR